MRGIGIRKVTGRKDCIKKCVAIPSRKAGISSNKFQIQNWIWRETRVAIPRRKAGISRSKKTNKKQIARITRVAIPRRKAGISSEDVKRFNHVIAHKDKLKLQSRVEKQAFQEERASNCIPMATSIVFFEYKQKLA